MEEITLQYFRVLFTTKDKKKTYADFNDLSSARSYTDWLENRGCTEITLEIKHY